MKRILFSLCLFFFAYSGSAQETPEVLFIYSKAPDCRAKDQDGDEIHFLPGVFGALREMKDDHLSIRCKCLLLIPDLLPFAEI